MGLGSNQKSPERQIKQAIKAIKALPKTAITQQSNVYWNKAWGLNKQPDFCNAVVEISTSLCPSLLLAYCQHIETNQGRIRKKRWGPRTLDIDIILYGCRTIQTQNLTIPHPHMLSRDFVLIPLAQIQNKKNLRQ